MKDLSPVQDAAYLERSCRGRSSVGRALLAAALLAGLTIPGCDGGCAAPAPTSGLASTSATVLPPVPRPALPMMAVDIPEPEKLWQQLRVLGGGSAFFMPKSLGALLVSWLDLPAGAAATIDTTPAHAAVALRDDQLVWTVAFHLKGADAFRNQLTANVDGRVARFRAERTDLLVELARTSPDEAPGSPALATSGPYLLVASDVETLRQLGPYAARTLPATSAERADLPARPEGVDLFAFGDGDLIRAWAGNGASAQAALRFGFADSLIGRDRAELLKLTAAAGAWTARLQSDPEALSFEATMLFDHAANAPLRSVMPTGGVDLLERLPASTAVAWAQPHPGDVDEQVGSLLVDWLAREPSAEAAETGDAATALRSAIAALSAAQAGSFAVGARFGAYGPDAYARSNVRDVDRASEALVELGEALSHPVVSQRLASYDLKLTVDTTRVERLTGEVRRFRLTRTDREGDAPSEPRTVDVMVQLREGQMLVAAGLDAGATLRELAEPTRSLGELSALAEALAAVGTDRMKQIGGVLLVEPERVAQALAGKPDAAPSGPAFAVAAAGHNGAKAEGVAPEVWLSVSVPRGRVRSLRQLLPPL